MKMELSRSSGIINLSEQTEIVERQWSNLLFDDITENLVNDLEKPDSRKIVDGGQIAWKSIPLHRTESLKELEMIGEKKISNIYVIKYIRGGKELYEVMTDVLFNFNRVVQRYGDGTLQGIVHFNVDNEVLKEILEDDLDLVTMRCGELYELHMGNIN